MDYSQSESRALSMLTKYGRDVTLRSYTTGTYNTATGTATPSTSDTTRKGALFDFGAGQTVSRGTLIQVGDKRLYLDAEATVNPQDHIIIDSVDYQIANIGEINPAGTRVLYDLHLRK